MSKKRLFSYLTIGIIIVYAFCILSSFLTLYRENSSKLKNSCVDASNSLFDSINTELNSYRESGVNDYNIEEVFRVCINDNIPYQNINELTIPYAYAVYNIDSEIVARSGSYISYNLPFTSSSLNCTVNIDDLLTDSIKKELQIYLDRYNNSNNNIALKSIDLCESGIKSITLWSIFDNSEDYVINFNDEEVIDTIDYSSTEEMPYISSLIIDGYAYFYNISGVGYNRAFFNSLNEEIDKLETDKFFYSYNDNIIEDYGNIYKESRIIYDGGKIYFLYATFAYSSGYETFFSSNFRLIAIIQTGLFLIISLLIYAFSFMLYNKGRHINDSKAAFTSAAAHELKTPLSIIQNQCECLIEGINKDKTDDYIDSIYNESLRMSKLFATLLQYNRLNSDKAIELEECNLTELIDSELDKYDPLIEEKGLLINKEVCCSPNIKCNKELISLVIDNYISNAIKYTRHGKIVKIKVTEVKKGKYKASVINEGSHIDDDDRLSVWDIFYRNDKSRNSEDNSTGMGLAISRKILELHKFKYGFNNLENGVEFYFITK